MVAMPSCWASLGRLIWTGLPSHRMVPLSAGLTPAMTLTRVDFPAPLSPSSATTSPAWTVRSTSLSAWTAPNLLEIPDSSRIGCAITCPRGDPLFGGRTVRPPIRSPGSLSGCDWSGSPGSGAGAAPVVAGPAGFRWEACGTRATYSVRSLPPCTARCRRTGRCRSPRWCRSRRRSRCLQCCPR